MSNKRHPIRLATIQVYLFARALRVLARQAEEELRARGVARQPADTEREVGHP